MIAAPQYRATLRRRDGWKSSPVVNLVALVVLLLTPCPTRADESQIADEWSPRTSISVRYFVELQSNSLDGGPEILTSPSGEYFAFMTRRGHLAEDVNIFELFVYRSSAVRNWVESGARARAPRPFRHLIRQTSSSLEANPAIEDVRWEEDGEALLFSGLADDGREQIFRYVIQRNHLSQISHTEHGVEWYAANGDGLVFGDLAPAPAAAPVYPMAFVERSNVVNGVIVTDYLSYVRGRRTTFASFGGGQARALPLSVSQAIPPVVSPDGRHAVAILESPRRFVIVDVKRATILPGLEGLVGDERVYSGAPAGWRQPAPAALWSPDGRFVILVNVTEPQSDASLTVSAYDIVTRLWTRLEPLVGAGASPSYVDKVRWLGDGRLLISRHEGDASVAGAVYSFVNGAISSRSATAEEVAVPLDSLGRLRGFQVAVVQDANHPPRVAVTLNGVAGILTDPDPALAGVWMAEQRPFHWTEPSGEVVTGGLYLPKGFRQGQRVPLIVQAYHYLPGQFLPDGENSTVDAAQLLAARGFAVLKYDIRPGASPSEGSQAVTRLDAAVDALVDAGIVDRDRIGMSGFSRAGFHVYWILTHPGRTQLAAAIAADSFSGSFSSYLHRAATDDLGGGRNFETVMGDGKSFWRNREAWLANETTFNVDRVRTPLLFTLNGGSGAGQHHFASVERIGAFLLNRRPIEYAYFPTGSHNLQRPRERIAMLEATVDWFAFWMQNVEDSDPAKMEQYARWRSLRSDWQRQQAWEGAGNPVGSVPSVALAPEGVQ